MLRIRIITGVLSAALIVGLAAPCFAQTQPSSAAEPCCPETVQAACHNGQVSDGCCQTGSGSREIQALSPWASGHKQTALTATFVAPGAMLSHDGNPAWPVASAILSASSPPPLRSLPLLI